MRFARRVRRLLRAVAGPALRGLAMARATHQKVIRQSAAIPYRRRRGGSRQDTTLEVLLITSRRSGHWIVPKGLVEPGMTEHDSAAKEAEEEAGVVGRVGTRPVGSFEYHKWGGRCHVAVFDLEVSRELPDWPERGQRQRRWASVPEACDLVHNDRLRALIATLPDRLARGD